MSPRIEVKQVQQNQQQMEESVDRLCTDFSLYDNKVVDKQDDIDKKIVTIKKLRDDLKLVSESKIHTRIVRGDDQEEKEYIKSIIEDSIKGIKNEISILENKKRISKEYSDTVRKKIDERIPIYVNETYNELIKEKEEINKFYKYNQHDENERKNLVNKYSETKSKLLKGTVAI